MTKGTQAMYIITGQSSLEASRAVNWVKSRLYCSFSSYVTLNTSFNLYTLEGSTFWALWLVILDRFYIAETLVLRISLFQDRLQSEKVFYPG